MIDLLSSIFTRSFYILTIKILDFHDVTSPFSPFRLLFIFFGWSGQKRHNKKEFAELAKNDWLSLGLLNFCLHSLWMLVRNWRIKRAGRRNRRVSVFVDIYSWFILVFEAENFHVFKFLNYKFIQARFLECKFTRVDTLNYNIPE
jgi:hypothetical protein